MRKIFCVSNDNAFNFVIILVIFTLVTLEIYVLYADTNEIFVALVPLVFINFFTSIFESLTDKNKMENYEKDKKRLGTILSLISVSFVILYLGVTTFKIENPINISLLIVILIIICSVIVAMIHVDRTVYDKSSNEEILKIIDEIKTTNNKEIEDEWDTQLILDNDDVLYININRKKYKDTNESS